MIHDFFKLLMYVRDKNKWYEGSKYIVFSCSARKTPNY
jgi:hypothetical protein